MPTFPETPFYPDSTIRCNHTQYLGLRRICHKFKDELIHTLRHRKCIGHAWLALVISPLLVDEPQEFGNKERGCRHIRD